MAEKTENEAKLAFASFCIEEYKTLHGLDGAEVAARFEKFGVIDHLLEHFEVLHTLDRSAIMDDIERFIAARRRKE